MKTKSLVIPIHSFVDVITNSSTEIYVHADENTISAVKQMIDSLLKTGGSNKTADDLFTFTLAPGHSNTAMIVTPKDGTSTDVIEAASKLSDLTGLFYIDAEYNG